MIPYTFLSQWIDDRNVLHELGRCSSKHRHRPHGWRISMHENRIETYKQGFETSIMMTETLPSVGARSFNNANMCLAS